MEMSPEIAVPGIIRYGNLDLFLNVWKLRRQVNGADIVRSRIVYNALRYSEGHAKGLDACGFKKAHGKADSWNCLQVIGVSSGLKKQYGFRKYLLVQFNGPNYGLRENLGKTDRVILSSHDSLDAAIHAYKLVKTVSNPPATTWCNPRPQEAL